MRVFDLCRAGNVKYMYSHAISSILIGEDVIERVKLEKPLRVKPITEPVTAATKRYVKAVVDLGVRCSDGFYEVNLEFLASQLSVQEGQVNKMLKALRL